MIKTLSVLVVMMSVGCAKTDSTDLLTSGIYADLDARATGDGKTTVYATLYVDSPTTLNFVELGSDDKLVATSGGTTQTMTQSELGNLVSHAASFTGDDAGTEFDVAFERKVDAGAPSSTISLPAPFDLDPTPATASRAAAITITWGPDGTSDKMLWNATGPCISPATGMASGDPGTLTIAAATFVKQTGSGIPDSCTLTFQLLRERTGTLDRHFTRGGSALGIQERTVTWTSTP